MAKYVAAANAPQSWKTTADFVCDGVADQVQILDAHATGEDIILSPGTFSINGTMGIHNTNLVGQGPEQTTLNFTNSARLYVDWGKEQVIEGFAYNGSGYTSGVWHGVLTCRGANKTFRNLKGWADNTIQAVFLVIGDPAVQNPVPITNIWVDNCHIDGADTYAFLHSQWFDQQGSPPYTQWTVQKDILYTNCSATNCGTDSSFNRWVTGFDFAELNNIENLVVRNCRAEKNWESGFHFEFGPMKINCLFEDCVSLNNGQKPYPTVFADNRTYPLFGRDYFGCGFTSQSAQPTSITLRRCYAEGNSWFGFYCTNGAHHYDCVEVRSGRTLLRNGTTRTITADQKQLFKVAGFRTYPSRESSGINNTYENCSSFYSEGFGTHIDNAKNIVIKNMDIVYPVGIENRAVQLGVEGNECNNITVDGLRLWSNLIGAIWCANVTNTHFTNTKIITTTPNPFTFTGANTSASSLVGYTVYSDAVLYFTLGARVDSGVGAQATLSGGSQQPFAAAPTQPEPIVPSGGGPKLTAEQTGATILLKWSD